MSSKRLSNSKGMPTRNRCGRNTRYNNYIDRLFNANNTAESVEAIEQIKRMYISAKQNIGKLVPKGASKMLSSLVRQRT